MNLEKATSYINALYEKRGFSKETYIQATELQEFGIVVDDDVSRMLYVLTRLTHARRILEIGTSIGYSTVSIANAIKGYDGKIFTIEYDQQVAQQAMRNFERAGVAHNIEVKIGDALEIVPRTQEQFDLIFQDVGDKELYPLLFDDCIRLLKPGGLFLAEDTLFPVMELSASWAHSVTPIQKFNEMVAESSFLESTILPVGDGLTVAVKMS
ncbi:MAG TPA: O-methyltransferase [Candidatus Acidoferrum sp.]|nr:O-methyltransferase [Candidatus Acidoferrum sp.]